MKPPSSPYAPCRGEGGGVRSLSGESGRLDGMAVAAAERLVAAAGGACAAAVDGAAEVAAATLSAVDGGCRDAI